MDIPTRYGLVYLRFDRSVLTCFWRTKQPISRLHSIVAILWSMAHRLARTLIPPSSTTCLLDESLVFGDVWLWNSRRHLENCKYTQWNPLRCWSSPRLGSPSSVHALGGAGSQPPVISTKGLSVITLRIFPFQFHTTIKEVWSGHVTNDQIPFHL